MSHRYHGDLVGLVLRDGCEECEERADSILGLTALDSTNIRRIATMARMKPDEGMSLADDRAVSWLRLAGRIVFASGITEEECR
jgi:hypothetical protein